MFLRPNLPRLVAGSLPANNISAFSLLRFPRRSTSTRFISSSLLNSPWSSFCCWRIFRSSLAAAAIFSSCAIRSWAIFSYSTLSLTIFSASFLCSSLSAPVRLALSRVFSSIANCAANTSTLFWIGAAAALVCPVTSAAFISVSVFCGLFPFKKSGAISINLIIISTNFSAHSDSFSRASPASLAIFINRKFMSTLPPRRARAASCISWNDLICATVNWVIYSKVLSVPPFISFSWSSLIATILAVISPCASCASFNCSLIGPKLLLYALNCPSTVPTSSAVLPMALPVILTASV